MAHRAAYSDSRTYFRTPVGGDQQDESWAAHWQNWAASTAAPPVDLGPAKIVEPPKLESPETVANRERVTRNLQGKA